MELLPGLHRLPLPLGNNPLGAVNAYVVTGDDGFLLIDCGWDSPAIRETFARELPRLGLEWADLRTLLLTHAHPDHYGLSGWIKEQAPDAAVVIHHAELPMMRARYRLERGAEYLEDFAYWLRTHGAPESDVPGLEATARPVVDRFRPAAPNRLLAGGETIEHGDYAFEVHWVPGHAAGQICLHARRQRVLISADHILPRITPVVGLSAQSVGSPLDDYVASLHAIRELDEAVDRILPGHGEPFIGLAERVDAILHHHEHRLAEMLAVTPPDGAPLSAYEVARRVRWRGGRRGWDDLSPFDRRVALLETVAHLHVLHGRGDLAKRFDGGRVRYGRARR